MGVNGDDARLRFIIEAEDRADAVMQKAEQRNARLVASSRAASTEETATVTKIGQASQITRQQIDDAIISLDKRGNALDGTSRKASAAFDREAQALRQLLLTANSGAGDMRQLDEIILNAETKMTSFDRTSALATRRISSGLLSVARTGDLGARGIQGLLGGLGDLAFGLGEGGPLLAAAGIAGVAMFDFWRRQQEEAKKANEQIEKNIDSVRKLGVAMEASTAQQAKLDLAKAQAEVSRLQALAKTFGDMGSAGAGALIDTNKELEKQLNLVDALKRTAGELGATAIKDATDFARNDNQARLERVIGDLRARITQADAENAQGDRDGLGRRVGSRENVGILVAQLRAAVAEAKQATRNEYGVTDIERVRAIEIGQDEFENLRRRTSATHEYNAERQRSVELARSLAIETRQLADEIGHEAELAGKDAIAALYKGIDKQVSTSTAVSPSEFDPSNPNKSTRKIGSYAQAALDAMHGISSYPSAEAQRAAEDNQRYQTNRSALGIDASRMPDEYKAKLDAIAKESKSVEEAERKKRALYMETYRITMQAAKDFADVTIGSHNRTLQAIGTVAATTRKLVIGAEAADAAVKSAKQFALVPAALAAGDFAGAALHGASGIQLAAAAALGFRESLGGGSTGGGGGGSSSSSSGSGVGTFRPDTANGQSGPLTINLISKHPASPDVVQSIAYELNRSDVLKRPPIEIPPSAGLTPYRGP